MGLAQAQMDVRAFSVVIIPALATDTVCCSYIYRINQILAYPHLLMQMCIKFPLSYHDFVKYTTSGIRHLIKFINTANTTVA